VGGGPGVNGDLGNVVDLVMDLVSDQTGLGNQVGVHGLVNGGSGDGLDGGDVVDHGGDNRGDSDSGSGVGNGDRGSSDGGDGGGGVDSGNSGGGNSSGGNSGGNSSAVSQAVSGNEAVSSDEAVSKEAMSSNNTSHDGGVSSRGSQGGAKKGRKDNKGVHVAES